jgi:hypothetical protein
MMHPTKMRGFGKISNIFLLCLCYLIDARSLLTLILAERVLNFYFPFATKSSKLLFPILVVNF